MSALAKSSCIACGQTVFAFRSEQFGWALADAQAGPGVGVRVTDTGDLIHEPDVCVLYRRHTHRDEEWYQDLAAMRQLWIRANWRVVGWTVMDSASLGDWSKEIACAMCGAEAGKPCTSLARGKGGGREIKHPHSARRMDRVAAAGEELVKVSGLLHVRPVGSELPERLR